ncbi:MAG: hypothetical protein AAB403_10080, partial [Planctomycetota bacterium]
KCSLCGIGVGGGFESRRVVVGRVGLCHACARDIRDYGYIYLGEGVGHGMARVLVLAGKHLKLVRVPGSALWALWRRPSPPEPEAAAAELLACSQGRASRTGRATGDTGEPEKGGHRGCGRDRGEAEGGAGEDGGGHQGGHRPGGGHGPEDGG